VSAAPLAVRRCAARRSDSPARGHRATLAGRRCCGGGSGTPFPARRPPHHTTATWLYVPPRTLAAMEPAGVPGIDASPSALPH